MRRGTTPTIVFNIPFQAANITKLSIVLKQNGKIVIERDLSATTVDAQTLSITLTESETLALDTEAPVYMQIRCGIGDERLASNIMQADVNDILKGGLL